MFGCFVYMSVYVPHVCLVPREARKEFLIPWSYSYRWLWAIWWVPGVETGSSGKTGSALNHGAIFLAPRTWNFSISSLLFFLSAFLLFFFFLNSWSHYVARSGWFHKLNPPECWGDKHTLPCPAVLLKHSAKGYSLPLDSWACSASFSLWMSRPQWYASQVSLPHRIIVSAAQVLLADSLQLSGSSEIASLIGMSFSQGYGLSGLATTNT